MSRFHDEFFRQGSPAHDALMIKCMSSAGITKILETIDINDLISSETLPQNKEYISANTTICYLKDEQCIGRRGCRSKWDDRDAQGKEHLPYISTNYHTKQSTCVIEHCPERDRCQVQDGKLPTQHNAVFSYGPTDRNHSFETEVIAKNGNFIIGYADAVIKLEYKGQINANIGNLISWENFAAYDVQIDVLIEAKPTLSSIGEVIRQLKTYKSILQRPHRHSSHMVPMLPVIVTYSVVESDALEYMKNEGISVVVFEEHK